MPTLSRWEGNNQAPVLALPRKCKIGGEPVTSIRAGTWDRSRKSVSQYLLGIEGKGNNVNKMFYTHLPRITSSVQVQIWLYRFKGQYVLEKCIANYNNQMSRHHKNGIDLPRVVQQEIRKSIDVDTNIRWMHVTRSVSIELHAFMPPICLSPHNYLLICHT